MATLLRALLDSDSHRPEALAQIRRALDNAGGNRSAAARALGVDRRTLERWCHRYPQVAKALSDLRAKHEYRCFGGFAEKDQKSS